MGAEGEKEGMGGEGGEGTGGKKKPGYTMAGVCASVTRGKDCVSLTPWFASMVSSGQGSQGI